jgi:hypothetical protein
MELGEVVNAPATARLQTELDLSTLPTGVDGPPLLIYNHNQVTHQEQDRG